MPPSSDRDFAVRRLSPGEWPLYKSTRLRALAADPSSFGATLAAEQAYDDGEWQRRIGASAVFGLFDGGDVCGMIGIGSRAETPDEAAIWGLWVAPQARGRGGAAALIAACLDEARAQKKWSRLVISRRDNNKSVEGVILRQGFAPFRSEPRDWPDGVSEPEHIYEMKVSHVA
jgi:RimJ/RimL family protein N-acetyltransferase